VWGCGEVEKLFYQNVRGSGLGWIGKKIFKTQKWDSPFFFKEISCPQKGSGKEGGWLKETSPVG